MDAAPQSRFVEPGARQHAIDNGHMGRFAVEYRRRYGESPSDTLKQR